jgi:phosphatidylserine/phosphatidylglycerophosphate/cardiolipin synthase-like enzyme
MKGSAMRPARRPNPDDRQRYRRTVLAVLLGGLLAARGPGRDAAAEDRPAALEVVFSPTQGAGALRNLLAREIRGARAALDIALYTGMTAETAREVARSARTCRVRLLVDPGALKPDRDGDDPGDRPEDGTPRWRGILAGAGAAVQVMPMPAGRASKTERPAFHHKFAVIDGATVITGSYNWSARGDGENYENLVVIRDRTLAGRFAEEFERLWAAAREEAPSPAAEGGAKSTGASGARVGARERRR